VGAPSGFQAPTFHHATFPPPQPWSSNSSTGQWESAQHWSASASQGQGQGADSPVSGGSSTSAQRLNPTSGGGGGSGLSFQHGGIGGGRVSGVVGGGFSINQHGGMEPSLQQQQHSYQELVGGSASGPNGGGGGGVVGTSLARYPSAAGLVITPKPDGAQHNVNNNNNNNLSDPLQVSTSVCACIFLQGFYCEGGIFFLLLTEYMRFWSSLCETY
jgi:hypothetical protein